MEGGHRGGGEDTGRGGAQRWKERGTQVERGGTEVEGGDTEVGGTQVEGGHRGRGGDTGEGGTGEGTPGLPFLPQKLRLKPWWQISRALLSDVPW